MIRFYARPIAMMSHRSCSKQKAATFAKGGTNLLELMNRKTSPARSN